MISGGVGGGAGMAAWSEVDENGKEQEVSWNILVVDDSALNRKMLMKLFRSVGQTVEEAVDGKDAVDKVTGRMAMQLPPYDAILMDFVMVSGRGSM